MGGINDQGPDHERQWLRLTADELLSGQLARASFRELPAFPGTEVAEEDVSVLEVGRVTCGTTSRGSVPAKQHEAEKAMIPFYSKAAVAQSACLRFPALLAHGDSNLERLLRVKDRVQARLVQRVHLALQRQREFLLNGSLADTFTVGGVRLLPVLESSKLQQALPRTDIDLCARLSTVCKGWEASPHVATALSTVLLSLLEALPEQQSGAALNTSMHSALSAVEQLSMQLLMSEDAAARRQALALLFALGVTEQRLSSILRAILLMLKEAQGSPPSSVLLPDAAKPFYERLSRVGYPFPLLLPNPSSLMSELTFRVDCRPPVREPCVPAAASIAAMTTDGGYLYIWYSAADAILKVGTGFKGTNAGQIYGRCNEVGRRGGLPNATWSVPETKATSEVSTPTFFDMPSLTAGWGTTHEPRSAVMTSVLRGVSSTANRGIASTMQVPGMAGSYTASGTSASLLPLSGSRRSGLPTSGGPSEQDTRLLTFQSSWALPLGSELGRTNHELQDHNAGTSSALGLSTEDVNRPQGTLSRFLAAFGLAQVRDLPLEASPAVLAEAKEDTSVGTERDPGSDSSRPLPNTAEQTATSAVSDAMEQHQSSPPEHQQTSSETLSLAEVKAEGGWIARRGGSSTARRMGRARRGGGTVRGGHAGISSTTTSDQSRAVSGAQRGCRQGRGTGVWAGGIAASPSFDLGAEQQLFRGRLDILTSDCLRRQHVSSRMEALLDHGMMRGLGGQWRDVGEAMNDVLRLATPHARMFQGPGEPELQRILTALSVASDHLEIGQLSDIAAALCQLLAEVGQGLGTTHQLVRLVDREFLHWLLPRLMRRLTSDEDRMRVAREVLDVLQRLTERVGPAERRQVVARVCGVLGPTMHQRPSTVDQTQVFVSMLNFVRTALTSSRGPVSLDADTGNQVLQLVRTIRLRDSTPSRSDITLLTLQVEDLTFAAMGRSQPVETDTSLLFGPASNAASAAEELASFLLGSGPLREGLLPTLAARLSERRGVLGRPRFSQALRDANPELYESVVALEMGADLLREFDRQRSVKFSLLQDLLPDLAAQIHEAIPQYFDDYVEPTPQDREEAMPLLARMPDASASAKTETSSAALGSAQQGASHAWVATVGPKVYMLSQSSVNSTVSCAVMRTLEGKIGKPHRPSVLTLTVIDKERMEMLPPQSVMLSFGIIKEQPVVHMASEGSRLIFMYLDVTGELVSEEFEEPFKVEGGVIQGGKVSRVSIDLDTADWQESSVALNGELLHVTTCRDGDEAESSASTCILYHLPSGTRLATQVGASPPVVCFSSCINALVGLNPFEHRLSVFACRPWGTSEGLSQSDEPSLQLAAMPESPTVGHVLLHLQRLAQTSQPRMAKGEPEGSVEGEVVLTCKGSDGESSVVIHINGQQLTLKEGGMLTMVILDERGRIRVDSTYTLRSKPQNRSSERVNGVEAVRQLADGRVVLVIKKPGVELNSDDHDILALIGLDREALRRVDKQEPLLCVGRKAAPRGTANIARKQPEDDMATLRLRLPAATNPVVIEYTAEALGLMLDLADVYDCETADSITLETSVQLLAANLQHLVHRQTRKTLEDAMLAPNGGDAPVLARLAGLMQRLWTERKAETTGDLPKSFAWLLSVLLGPDHLPWLIHHDAAARSFKSVLNGIMESELTEGTNRSQDLAACTHSDWQAVISAAQAQLTQIRWGRGLKEQGGPSWAVCLRFHHLLESVLGGLRREASKPLTPRSAAASWATFSTSQACQLVTSSLLVAPPLIDSTVLDWILGARKTLQEISSLLQQSDPTESEGRRQAIELDRFLSSSYAKSAVACFSGVPSAAPKESQLAEAMSLLAPQSDIMDTAAFIESPSTQASQSPEMYKGEALLTHLATRAGRERTPDSQPSGRFLAALRKANVFWHCNAGPDVVQSGFAAGAVLVRYVGLADEADQLATGTLTEPSKALQQAWKAGTAAMHSAMTMTDHRPTAPSRVDLVESDDKRERMQASSNHVKRAKFLLRHMRPCSDGANRKSVLAFIKDADLSDVIAVCRLREQSAQQRLQGFSMLLTLAQSAESHMARLIVLHAWLQAMRDCSDGGTGESHYLAGLSGCTAETRAQLIAKYHEFNDVLMRYLTEHEMATTDGEPDVYFGNDTIYSCPLSYCVLLYTLRCLALDYDKVFDTQVVTQVCPAVQRLLEHPEAEVRSLASDLFRLLLSNAPEVQAAAYIKTELRKVQTALLNAAAFGQEASLVTYDQCIIGPYKVLLQGPCPLANNGVGRTLQSAHVVGHQSLSLWCMWEGGSKGVLVSKACTRTSSKGSSIVVWYTLGLAACPGSSDEVVVRFASTDGAVNVKSKAKLRRGVWGHIAVSWDAKESRRVELFINGEPDKACDLPLGDQQRRASFLDDPSYPLIVGRTPAYLKAMQPAEAVVFRVAAFEVPLITEQVAVVRATDMEAFKETLDNNTFELSEQSLLASLGIVYELTATQTEGSGTFDGALLSLSAVLDARDLTSVEFRLCCMKLLETTLPMSPIHLSHAEKRAIVRRLMVEVGATVCAQVGATAGPQGVPHTMSRDSADGAFALAQAQLQLLRTLTDAEGWSDVIKAQMVHGMQQSSAVLRQLDTTPFRELSSAQQDALFTGVTTYAMFGGALEGLYAGSSALWQQDATGKVFEPCTILAHWHEDADNPESHHGSGLTILSHGGPEKVERVPLSRVRVRQQPQQPELCGVLAVDAGFIEQLCVSFEGLSSYGNGGGYALAAVYRAYALQGISVLMTSNPNLLALYGKRVFPSLNELLTRQTPNDKVTLFGRGPCGPKLDLFENVRLEGATSLTASFLSMSEVKDADTYLAMYEAGTRSAHWGKPRFCGRLADGSRETSVSIAADSFDLHLHVGGKVASSSSWTLAVTAGQGSAKVQTGYPTEQVLFDLAASDQQSRVTRRQKRRYKGKKSSSGSVQAADETALEDAALRKVAFNPIDEETCWVSLSPVCGEEGATEEFPLSVSGTQPRRGSSSAHTDSVFECVTSPTSTDTASNRSGRHGSGGGRLNRTDDVAKLRTVYADATLLRAAEDCLVTLVVGSLAHEGSFDFEWCNGDADMFFDVMEAVLRRPEVSLEVYPHLRRKLHLASHAADCQSDVQILLSALAKGAIDRVMRRCENDVQLTMLEALVPHLLVDKATTRLTLTFGEDAQQLRAQPCWVYFCQRGIVRVLKDKSPTTDKALELAWLVLDVLCAKRLHDSRMEPWLDTTTLITTLTRYVKLQPELDHRILSLITVLFNSVRQPSPEVRDLVEAVCQVARAREDLTRGQGCSRTSKALIEAAVVGTFAQASTAQGQESPSITRSPVECASELWKVYVLLKTLTSAGPPAISVPDLDQHTLAALHSCRGQVVPMVERMNSLARTCGMDVGRVLGLQEFQQLAGEESQAVIALHALHTQLSGALRYLCLDTFSNAGSCAHLLLRCRAHLLTSVKLSIFNEGLKHTEMSQGTSQTLCLNRHIPTPLFVQAFQRLHALDPCTVRRPDRAYFTKLEGEVAIDDGGLYRQSYVDLCAELQSDRLPLFKPAEAGRWILNTDRSTSGMLEKYEFVGKLMGMAIRTKVVMPLDLEEDVWRYLTFGDEVMSSPPRDLGTKLKADAEDASHQEFGRRAAAMRRGMGCLVPHRLLGLFTAHELEVLVCGAPLDIDQLQRSCTYEGCRPSDDLITNLWTILKDDFTDVQRARFLKFVLGTSRLPQTFNGQLSIAVDTSRTPRHLPRARTCVFKLLLPPYGSNKEMLSAKLSLAITEETFGMEG